MYPTQYEQAFLELIKSEVEKSGNSALFATIAEVESLHRVMFNLRESAWPDYMFGQAVKAFQSIGVPKAEALGQIVEREYALAKAGRWFNPVKDLGRDKVAELAREIDRRLYGRGSHRNLQVKFVQDIAGLKPLFRSNSKISWLGRPDTDIEGCLLDNTFSLSVDQYQQGAPRGYVPYDDPRSIEKREKARPILGSIGLAVQLIQEAAIIPKFYDRLAEVFGGFARQHTLNQVIKRELRGAVIWEAGVEFYNSYQDYERTRYDVCANPYLLQLELMEMGLWYAGSMLGEDRGTKEIIVFEAKV